jgi:hypothetical protein
VDRAAPERPDREALIEINLRRQVLIEQLTTRVGISAVRPSSSQRPHLICSMKRREQTSHEMGHR